MEIPRCRKYKLFGGDSAWMVKEWVRKARLYAEVQKKEKEFWDVYEWLVKRGNPRRNERIW